MATTMEIILKRSSKVYHPGEKIYGSVMVTCSSKGDTKHDGITLQLEGLLSMQLSPRTVGLIDTLVNSPKPSVLHSELVEVCRVGRFSAGTTELPFEVTLPFSSLKKPLYETFHGNCINIHYALRCSMKRSLLAKPLVQMIEFIVEQKNSPAPPIPRLRQFKLTPASVANAGERARLPRFSVTGHLDSDTWQLAAPLTGEVCVRECTGGVISSIELQLHRLETCGNPADTSAPKESKDLCGVL